MDALDFLKVFDSGSVDGVLYDPPYSLRQVVECYKGFGKEVTQETTQASWRSRHLDEITRILKPGGKAICFGWNSAGVGKTRGFVLQRVLLVPHGGSKHDTIVTVETKGRSYIVDANKKIDRDSGDRKELPMRTDLLKQWLKMYPYGYCDGINFQTCRSTTSACPYCRSNVHCSDGNAAVAYYRELIRFMRFKPRRAAKISLMFADTLPSIMRSLDAKIAEIERERISI